MNANNPKPRRKNKATAIRINSQVKTWGKQLAAREARTFNDWITQTIIRLRMEQMHKDSMR